MTHFLAKHSQRIQVTAMSPEALSLTAMSTREGFSNVKLIQATRIPSESPLQEKTSGIPGLGYAMLERHTAAWMNIMNKFSDRRKRTVGSYPIRICHVSGIAYVYYI